MNNQFKSRSSSVIRIIAFVLIHTFLVDQFAFAAGDLKSVDFSLFHAQPMGFKLPESVAVVEEQFKASSPNAAGMSFPNVFVGDQTGADSRLRGNDTRRGDDKTLILLQDAHTNESGQLNLAKAMDLIIRREKIRYVFVEAGFDDVSLTFLKDKAPLERRKNVAMSYLKKGELSGSEYLNLTSDEDFTLWGVEDRELYWQSVDVYRAIAQNRERFQDYLQKIETTVGTLKPKIFNPSLFAFDEKHEAFLKEKIPLTDYFAALADAAERAGIDLNFYPHIQTLNNVREKEGRIHFKAANEEQARLVASLSGGELEELLAAAGKDHAVSKISGQSHPDQEAFYLTLEAVIARRSPGPSLRGGAEGVDEAISANKIASPLASLGARNDNDVQQAYPELAKYFDYLKEARKLDPRKLLEEQKAIELRIYDTLTKTTDERALHRISSNLRSLKALLNLTLTPDEFHAYESSPESFDVVSMTAFLNRKIMEFRNYYERVVFLENGYEDIVKKAEEFYHLTYERDKVFLAKTLKKMDETGERKGILIAGGYHSPNIKEMLKSANISFICITPQILNPTNLKRYEGLLLGQQRVIAREPKAPEAIPQRSPRASEYVGARDDAARQLALLMLMSRELGPVLTIQLLTKALEIAAPKAAVVRPTPAEQATALMVLISYWNRLKTQVGRRAGNVQQGLSPKGTVPVVASTSQGARMAVTGETNGSLEMAGFDPKAGVARKLKGAPFSPLAASSSLPSSLPASGSFHPRGARMAATPVLIPQIPNLAKQTVRLDTSEVIQWLKKAVLKNGTGKGILHVFKLEELDKSESDLQRFTLKLNDERIEVYSQSGAQLTPIKLAQSFILTRQGQVVLFQPHSMDSEALGYLSRLPVKTFSELGFSEPGQVRSANRDKLIPLVYRAVQEAAAYAANNRVEIVKVYYDSAEIASQSLDSDGELSEPDLLAAQALGKVPYLDASDLVWVTGSEVFIRSEGARMAAKRKPSEMQKVLKLLTQNLAEGDPEAHANYNHLLKAVRTEQPVQSDKVIPLMKQYAAYSHERAVEIVRDYNQRQSKTKNGQTAHAAIVKKSGRVFLELKRQKIPLDSQEGRFGIKFPDQKKFLIRLSKWQKRGWLPANVQFRYRLNDFAGWDLLIRHPNLSTTQVWTGNQGQLATVLNQLIDQSAVSGARMATLAEATAPALIPQISSPTEETVRLDTSNVLGWLKKSVLANGRSASIHVGYDSALDGPLDSLTIKLNADGAIELTDAGLEFGKSPIISPKDIFLLNRDGHVVLFRGSPNFKESPFLLRIPSMTFNDLSFSGALLPIPPTPLEVNSVEGRQVEEVAAEQGQPGIVGPKLRKWFLSAAYGTIAFVVGLTAFFTIRSIYSDSPALPTAERFRRSNNRAQSGIWMDRLIPGDQSGLYSGELTFKITLLEEMAKKDAVERFGLNEGDIQKVRINPFPPASIDVTFVKEGKKTTAVYDYDPQAIKVILREEVSPPDDTLRGKFIPGARMAAHDLTWDEFIARVRGHQIRPTQAIMIHTNITSPSTQAYFSHLDNESAPSVLFYTDMQGHLDSIGRGYVQAIDVVDTHAASGARLAVTLDGSLESFGVQHSIAKLSREEGMELLEHLLLRKLLNERRLTGTFDLRGSQNVDAFPEAENIVTKLLYDRQRGSGQRIKDLLSDTRERVFEPGPNALFAVVDRGDGKSAELIYLPEGSRNGVFDRLSFSEAKIFMAAPSPAKNGARLAEQKNGAAAPDYFAMLEDLAKKQADVTVTYDDPQAGRWKYPRGTIIGVERVEGGLTVKISWQSGLPTIIPIAAIRDVQFTLSTSAPTTPPAARLAAGETVIPLRVGILSSAQQGHTAFIDYKIDSKDLGAKIELNGVPQLRSQLPNVVDVQTVIRPNSDKKPTTIFEITLSLPEHMTFEELVDLTKALLDKKAKEPLEAADAIKEVLKEIHSSSGARLVAIGDQKTLARFLEPTTTAGLRAPVSPFAITRPGVPLLNPEEKALLRELTLRVDLTQDSELRKFFALLVESLSVKFRIARLDLTGKEVEPGSRRPVAALALLAEGVEEPVLYIENPHQALLELQAKESNASSKRIRPRDLEGMAKIAHVDAQMSAPDALVGETNVPIGYQFSLGASLGKIKDPSRFEAQLELFVRQIFMMNRYAREHNRQRTVFLDLAGLDQEQTRTVKEVLPEDTRNKLSIVFGKAPSDFKGVVAEFTAPGQDFKPTTNNFSVPIDGISEDGDEFLAWVQAMWFAELAGRSLAITATRDNDRIQIQFDKAAEAFPQALLDYFNSHTGKVKISKTTLIAILKGGNQHIRFWLAIGKIPIDALIEGARMAQLVVGHAA